MSTRTEAQKQQALYRNRLRKRQRTLVQKAHDFHQVTGAEVYLVMYHHSQFHVYTSNQSPDWPPALHNIKLTYPLPIIHTAHGIESLSRMREATRESDGDSAGTCLTAAAAISTSPPCTPSTLVPSVPKSKHDTGPRSLPSPDTSLRTPLPAKSAGSPKPLLATPSRHRVRKATMRLMSQPHRL